MLGIELIIGLIVGLYFYSVLSGNLTGENLIDPLIARSGPTCVMNLD